MLLVIWRTVSADQSLSTGLFSVLWRDLLPFCASKQVENGISGCLQDKSNSFPLEKSPRNSLTRFTTHWYWTTTAWTLTTLATNWQRKSETHNLRATTILVLLVQRSARQVKSTWEREIKNNQWVSSLLLSFYKCSQSWNHQKARRDWTLKQNHTRFDLDHWLKRKHLYFSLSSLFCLIY